MKAVIAIKNSNIKLTNYDVKQINKILRGLREGIYNVSGRTCYYILKEPIEFNGIVYRSVKIKGCGYKNVDTNEYCKVGHKVFFRKDPHIGFDNNKNIRLVYSDVAPLGGITFRKAKNEYYNFLKLYKKGVSTLLPYSVVIYNHKKNNNQKIGANIALCEDMYGFRMNKLFYENKYITSKEMDYYNLILKNEDIIGDIYDINIRLKLCCVIARKYASEIKKFSEAGLYIHSGGWSNIQYSLSRKKVVLVDLDSSKKVDTEDRELIKLYNIRDFVSNLYRLLISLYNPKVIHQIDINILNKNNLILALLEGYFDKVDKKTLKEISYRILNFYYDNCFIKIKNIEHTMDTIKEEEKKNYELNTKEFYEFCLKLLCNLVE